ncbi:MAG: hypothetical protein ACUVS5_13035 [Anaerolineae bacterium]
MVHDYELKKLVVGSANEYARGFAWKVSRDAEEVVELLKDGWELVAGLCDDPACYPCERIMQAILDDELS